MSRFSHLIFLDYVIVACSKIHHRLLSVVHNGACPAVERSNVVTSNARFFRTVCKSDASARSDEPQRKGPLFVFILQLPRAQLSARIRDDRDKSNFVSAVQAEENPFQFSLLKSSFLHAFSTSLTPTSFSRKDSPRGANRDGIKDETPGCRLRFWGEPHRGIHGSCRFDTRACLVGHSSRFRYYKAVRRISRQVLGKLAAGGAL